MRRRVHRALPAVLAVLVASSLAPVESSSGAVAAPRFVRNIPSGETGWFSSPGLVDLDRDGRLEIVAPFHSTFVLDAKGRRLGRGTATDGRVYAPSVVADLDADGVPEVVVGGNEGTGLRLKAAGRPRPAAAASAPKRAVSPQPTSTETAASRW